MGQFAPIGLPEYGTSRTNKKLYRSAEDLESEFSDPAAAAKVIVDSATTEDDHSEHETPTHRLKALGVAAMLSGGNFDEATKSKIESYVATYSAEPGNEKAVGALRAALADPNGLRSRVKDFDKLAAKTYHQAARTGYLRAIAEENRATSAQEEEKAKSRKAWRESTLGKLTDVAANTLADPQVQTAIQGASSLTPQTRVAAAGGYLLAGIMSAVGEFASQEKGTPLGKALARSAEAFAYAAIPATSMRREDLGANPVQTSEQRQARYGNDPQDGPSPTLLDWVAHTAGLRDEPSGVQQHTIQSILPSVDIPFVGEGDQLVQDHPILTMLPDMAFGEGAALGARVKTKFAARAIAKKAKAASTAASELQRLQDVAPSVDVVEPSPEQKPLKPQSPAFKAEAKAEDKKFARIVRQDISAKLGVDIFNPNSVDNFNVPEKATPQALGVLRQRAVEAYWQSEFVIKTAEELSDQLANKHETHVELEDLPSAAKTVEQANNFRLAILPKIAVLDEVLAKKLGEEPISGGPSDLELLVGNPDIQANAPGKLENVQLETAVDAAKLVLDQYPKAMSVYDLPLQAREALSDFLTMNQIKQIMAKPVGQRAQAVSSYISWNKSAASRMTEARHRQMDKAFASGDLFVPDAKRDMPQLVGKDVGNSPSSYGVIDENTRTVEGKIANHYANAANIDAEAPGVKFDPAQTYEQNAAEGRLSPSQQQLVDLREEILFGDDAYAELAKTQPDNTLVDATQVDNLLPDLRDAPTQADRTVNEAAPTRVNAVQNVPLTVSERMKRKQAAKDALKNGPPEKLAEQMAQNLRAELEQQVLASQQAAEAEKAASKEAPEAQPPKKPGPGDALTPTEQQVAEITDADTARAKSSDELVLQALEENEKTQSAANKNDQSQVKVTFGAETGTPTQPGSPETSQPTVTFDPPVDASPADSFWWTQSGSMLAWLRQASTKGVKLPEVLPQLRLGNNPWTINANGTVHPRSVFSVLRYKGQDGKTYTRKLAFDDPLMHIAHVYYNHVRLKNLGNVNPKMLDSWGKGVPRIQPYLNLIAQQLGWTPKDLFDLGAVADAIALKYVEAEQSGASKKAYSNAAEKAFPKLFESPEEMGEIVDIRGKIDENKLNTNDPRSKEQVVKIKTRDPSEGLILLHGGIGPVLSSEQAVSAVQTLMRLIAKAWNRVRHQTKSIASHILNPATYSEQNGRWVQESAVLLGQYKNQFARIFQTNLKEAERQTGVELTSGLTVSQSVAAMIHATGRLTRDKFKETLYRKAVPRDAEGNVIAVNPESYTASGFRVDDIKHARRTLEAIADAEKLYASDKKVQVYAEVMKKTLAQMWEIQKNTLRQTWREADVEYANEAFWEKWQKKAGYNFRDLQNRDPKAYTIAVQQMIDAYLAHVTDKETGLPVGEVRSRLTHKSLEDAAIRPDVRRIDGEIIHNLGMADSFNEYVQLATKNPEVLVTAGDVMQRYIIDVASSLSLDPVLRLADHEMAQGRLQQVDFDALVLGLNGLVNTRTAFEKVVDSMVRKYRTTQFLDDVIGYEDSVAVRPTSRKLQQLRTLAAAAQIAYRIRVGVGNLIGLLHTANELGYWETAKHVPEGLINSWTYLRDKKKAQGSGDIAKFTPAVSNILEHNPHWYSDLQAVFDRETLGMPKDLPFADRAKWIAENRGVSAVGKAVWKGALEKGMSVVTNPEAFLRFTTWSTAFDKQVGRLWKERLQERGISGGSLTAQQLADPAFMAQHLPDYSKMGREITWQASQYAMTVTEAIHGQGAMTRPSALRGPFVETAAMYTLWPVAQMQNALRHTKGMPQFLRQMKRALSDGNLKKAAQLFYRNDDAAWVLRTLVSSAILYYFAGPGDDERKAFFADSASKNDFLANFDLETDAFNMFFWGSILGGETSASHIGDAAKALESGDVGRAIQNTGAAAGTALGGITGPVVRAATDKNFSAGDAATSIGVPFFGAMKQVFYGLNPELFEKQSPGPVQELKDIAKVLSGEEDIVDVLASRRARIDRAFNEGNINAVKMLLGMGKQDNDLNRALLGYMADASADSSRRRDLVQDFVSVQRKLARLEDFKDNTKPTDDKAVVRNIKNEKELAERRQELEEEAQEILAAWRENGFTEEQLRAGVLTFTAYTQDGLTRLAEQYKRLPTKQKRLFLQEIEKARQQYEQEFSVGAEEPSGDKE